MNEWKSQALVTALQYSDVFEIMSGIHDIIFSIVMFRATWYYLYNLKNEKNTPGAASVTFTGLQLTTLLKVTPLHGYFSRSLNCTNSSQIVNGWKQ